MKKRTLSIILLLALLLFFTISAYAQFNPPAISDNFECKFYEYKTSLKQHPEFKEECYNVGLLQAEINSAKLALECIKLVKSERELIILMILPPPNKSPDQINFEHQDLKKLSDLIKDFKNYVNSSPYLKEALVFFNN